MCMYNVCHVVMYKYMTDATQKWLPQFFAKTNAQSMIHVYREFYDGIVLNYLALRVHGGS